MADKKDSFGTPFADFVRYEHESKGKSEGNDESYGKYLFGQNYIDPTDPNSGTKHTWSSYTSGRILIRLFSRGLMGATLYTMGHHAVRRQLPGYSAEIPLAQLGKVTQYPLRYVARGFDVTLGKVIKSYVKAISPAARAEEFANNAVRFRIKNDFGDPSGLGRSLGHEMTGMTFDFAMGSVGDAWGREIAQAFDPNFKNSWERDDGSFDTKEFGKAVVRKTWRIFSKNQGEDWAAALPYVYQMRWQRQALNRVYPGFKFTSDRQLNGGSWRLDSQGRIAESYAKAGAIDLQLRFTGYNWYTLMYRDFYDMIADTYNHYQEHGELPQIRLPEKPVHAALDGLSSTFRYTLKSAIKAGIYMTPAVPFFWITRTPQTKYKGIGCYIDPDRTSGRSGIATMPNGTEFSFKDSRKSFWTDNGYRMKPGEQLTINGRNPMSIPNSDLGSHFYPYDAKHTRGVTDKILNPFGKASFEGGRKLYKALNRAGLASVKQREFIHTLTDASVSYTPYMIAKAETALRWDKKPMDDAIYRFIDGVSSFNLGEIKGGFSDIRQMMMNPPSNKRVEELESEKEERLQREWEERRRDKEERDQKMAPKEEKPKNMVSEADLEERIKAKIVDPEHASLAERFKQDNEVPNGVSIH